MTECLPQNTVIFCLERIDDDYSVTLDEVYSYAKKIGINCDEELDLLPIALKGLIHPLPGDWIPCYDINQQAYFYFNKKSNLSQWEHPTDKYYEKIISEIRKRNIDVENIKDYATFLESFKMLPLRQKKKKPELIPIKQLLKLRDEENFTFENDKLKSDLHSELKSKSDSNLKKSVTFDNNEFRSRFAGNVYNDEMEKQFGENDHISPEELWDSEMKENVFLRQKNSSKPDSALNISSGINFYSNQKSSSISRSQKNFKRLHINLRHPESNIFSDSNRDDTSKNVLSESMSSDTVSEEKTAPQNVLANITESGIDVSTVTDIQKLKAKSMMNNQNNDLDKQILHYVQESVTNLERNLNFRLETKIDKEIAKLKKVYRDKFESNLNLPTNFLEKHEYEIQMTEINESISSFQREIEEKNKNNLQYLQELKNSQTREIEEMKRSIDEKLKSAFTQNSMTYLDNARKELDQFIRDKIKSIDENVEKKFKSLEILQKSEVENFRMEKEKLTSEQYKKLNFLMEEYKKQKEMETENLKTAVRSELKELLDNINEKENIIFQQNVKKIIQEVNTKTKEIVSSSNTIQLRTIATQTEKISKQTRETDEIMQKINELSSNMKILIKQVQQVKNQETIEEFRLPVKNEYRGLFTDNLHQDKNQLSVLPKFERNMVELDEFNNDIDQELELYRKKYLWNSKSFANRR